MRRAVKVTLAFATESKRRKIAALLESYRAAVNFYIRSLWHDRGKLDKSTLARLSHTRLSERYKSQALKQALETVVATRKAAKAIGRPASIPVFCGAAVLDAKFVSIEEGKGCFDLAIRLSVLKKGERITVPTKRTAVLNKWLAESGATLIQGCALSEKGIVLWVEIPEAKPREEGEVVAFDIGKNKMLSCSDGRHYGRDFAARIDRVKRCKPGSKGKRKAIRARDNYIGQVLNTIDWPSFSIVGLEDLRGIKNGKRKGRNKAFRKALAPWTHRQVVTRIEQKAQANRVRLVFVDPRNTSRCCPLCGKTDQESRKGEKFHCIHCDHRDDADHVGAVNILARTLQAVGSVESPMLQNSMME